jgi:uncharacterized membrane protein
MGTVAQYAPRVGYWVLAFLAVGVALVAFRFITFDPAVAPPELRPNMEGRTLVFVTHTLAGAVAMIVGIWQFLPRTRRTRWHRIEGRIYVSACVIGALAGFYIAWFSTAGIWASVGFAILAVLWLATTITGFVFARRKDFVSHRRWMIRSYALTAAAITLRLIVPIGVVLGYTFYEAYIAAAWLCWILNLAAVEIWFAMRPQPSRAEVLATG